MQLVKGEDGQIVRGEDGEDCFEVVRTTQWLRGRAGNADVPTHAKSTANLDSEIGEEVTTQV